MMYFLNHAWLRRHYASFDLPAGIAFQQVDAVRVAAMLRSLSCREQNRLVFQEHFPEIDSQVYLAGHIQCSTHTPPRFSYLPLPSIGYVHADGMIRQLMIAEPYGHNGALARWAQEQLRNQVLRDIHRHECGALLDLWHQESRITIEQYVRESRTWSTVTPLLLPGFDDGKHSKAVKLFLTAVRQAGLPIDVIADVALRKAPFWPGSQHPRWYYRPKYLKHSPGWHAWMRLREPIPGPLALGAGRHCGLGLFASSSESD